MTSAKAARAARAARAADAATTKKAAAAAARRRRRRLVAVVSAVVVAVFVAAGVAVQVHRNAAPATTAIPAHTDGYTIPTGNTAAPVTVTVYEDFQCPACALFEKDAAETINALRDAGTVKVVYRPMTFLDKASANKYSSRALNAALCVVDTAPAAFPAFHDALYANQPAEGTSGPDNAALAAAAKRSGADVTSCINAGTFDAWARASTNAASKDGVTRTPTILVNGKPLAEPNAQTLLAAVHAAH